MRTLLVLVCVLSACNSNHSPPFEISLGLAEKAPAPDTAAPVPAVAPATTAKVTTGAATGAIAGGLASATPPTPERRASGNGFTVALVDGWEVRTANPSAFGAARGSTATIQIGLPSGADIQRYSEATTQRAMCDEIFRKTARSLQLDEFQAIGSTGCERVGALVGMVVVGIITAREGRPYLAMCAGHDGDRSVWEPECRAIAASLRWEANARMTPVQTQMQVKTETVEGGIRMELGGASLTLVNGWAPNPAGGEGDIRFSGIRGTGLGVITVGIVAEGMLEIGSVAKCKAAALAMAQELGSKLVRSAFVGHRCVATLNSGDSLNELVLGYGAKRRMVWSMCVHAPDDPESAAECERMNASLTFE